MGAGAKNLEQIMLLTERGLLPPGGRVCDIGTSELQGQAIAEGAASFLDYYARKGGGGPASAPPETLAAFANRGFLGDLFTLAGFEYVALDIFQAPRTVLFDLNAHEPGPGLAGTFDLVLNFGTTEHVVNQYLAHRTIYDLLKVGGVAYHDLPMSGYAGHGYFKYDPQFFLDLARANGAEVVLDRLSIGHRAPSPTGLDPDAQVEWRDYGVEIAMARREAGPLRLPLETSTSLAVDPAFATATSDMVRPASGLAVRYATIEGPKAAPESALGGLIGRVRRKAASLKRE